MTIFKVRDPDIDPDEWHSISASDEAAAALDYVNEHVDPRGLADDAFEILVRAPGVEPRDASTVRIRLVPAHFEVA